MLSFFRNSKLDADIGYITNDRGEFEDSDQASLRMKLVFNYNVKYHLPKFGNLTKL
jgi:iron complex outermembrane receptor protein